MGACLQMEHIPARKKLKNRKASIQHILFDGEDFELIFSAPPLTPSLIQSFQNQFKIPLTCTGVFHKQPEIRIFWEEEELFPNGTPFQHFK